MAAKSILCVSWNLELQCPDQQALNQSFVQYITQLQDNERPNLIVIGLQETASYKKIGEGVFIGNKLVERGKLLGNNHILNENPYRLLDTVRFKGMTKMKQMFGKKAQQCLQILVRKKDRKSVEVYLEGHQKAKGREKGFCFAELGFYDRKMCFISTHLDSSNSEERAKECREIRNTILRHARLNGKYHAIFMMGDLNYRLKAREIHTNITMQHHMFDSATYSSDKKKWGKICGAGGMVNKLATPAGRNFVRVNCDGFNEEHFANLPFKWPDFEDGSFPTYKRKKSKKFYSEIKKLKDCQNRNVDRNIIKNIYYSSSSWSTKKRPDSWDMGWLDRIGYALDPADPNCCNDSGMQMIGRGLNYNQPENIKIGSWPHVPYGDHVPVYSLFKINGFDRVIDAADAYDKVVIRRESLYRTVGGDMETQIERDVALWFGAMTKGGGEPWKVGMLKRLFSVLYFGGLMVHRRKGWRPWRHCGQPVCCSISHTARVLIAMPPGEAGKEFWKWLWGKDGEENAMRPRGRMMATHGISSCRKTSSRLYEVSKEVKETKGVLAGIDIINHHYGVNIALGGYGNTNPVSGRLIDERGEHGHLYIAYGRAKSIQNRKRRRAILVGVEQSAPWDRYDRQRGNLITMFQGKRQKPDGVPDQYGGKHASGGHNRYSATGGDDFSYKKVSSALGGFGPRRGHYIDGMYLDLSRERFEYVKSKPFNPENLGDCGKTPMPIRIWREYKRRHHL